MHKEKRVKETAVTALGSEKKSHFSACFYISGNFLLSYPLANLLPLRRPSLLVTIQQDFGVHLRLQNSG
jgi:hypothetical protein